MHIAYELVPVTVRINEDSADGFTYTGLCRVGQHTLLMISQLVVYRFTLSIGQDDPVENIFII